MKKRNRRIAIIRHLILLVVSVCIGYPLLWMIIGSLKTKSELYTDIWGLPKVLQFDNYVQAFKALNYLRAFGNTLLIAVIALIGILICSYLAAYAIARIPFKGKQVVYLSFVLRLNLPILLLLIPLYSMLTQMKLVDSHIGIALVYINGGISFSTFVLINDLKKIPMELEDAARIDGCSRLQILLRIILPLSRGALASVIILQFLNVWNDMFLPLVLLRRTDMRTLVLGLLNFNDSYGNTNFTLVFAALAIINVPVLIVYIIFQRQFISGLTSGAVKS